MIITNKNIELTVADGICTVVPNSRRTIATLTASGTVTIIVDSSNSQIGDELVLIASKDSDELLLEFTIENGVVFTSCRSIENGTFGINNKWIGHFFFDGDKFLNTYENC